MNWHGNRFNETYTFVKVSPVDWSENGTYDFITSGSIEMSDDNKYKVTGSFQFDGPELPDPNYYIRVYYSFDAANETTHKIEHAKIPLATTIISYPTKRMQETTIGMLYSGSLTASSMLKILDDKKYGQPFIIKKNLNAVYKAFELIEEFGLRVDYTPSSAVLSSDHTFSSDASYLDIVNWLCEYAGYREVFVNAEGVIQMHPLLKPEQDLNPVVFRNDDKSIMYPELDEENDWQSRANVVKKIYNTDKAWAVATARNIRGSKMSLEALNGREITKIDDVSDVDANKNILEQLLTQAEDDLRDQANETEIVTFSHAYIPMELKKAVKIEYSDMEWLGSAENISIDLNPSTKTQTKISKTIENTIEITKDGYMKNRDGGEEIRNG